MKEILVAVSPGELLDKITILEIKSERMDDPQKVVNVRHELGLLSKVWSDSLTEDETISELHRLLKSINEELWEIEDDIRDKERHDRFGHDWCKHPCRLLEERSCLTYSVSPSHLVVLLEEASK